ncbi:hypothetical protein SAMN02745221_00117 [Thermosyntropha lipolytica DSM 11003]|uniref:Uncharacterized protein n=1 Tax=Thermosyntropha lipolytica DSM 11003 TaxID=1123382 RepID=A0A1M5JGV1_9FIRM|nr:hypothetical protein [Thermosyntropha lipolytica]SHG39782.1 hypothetical protein SAMN02745221_00117 [Thermosyntropha lipolytica DSM 11003]
MLRIYSTGPVENAFAHAATNVWIKVLNISSKYKVEVEVKIFRLNGKKSEIDSASFSVPPNASDFAVFDITNLVEYEVQIRVKKPKYALVSVWSKNADAELVNGQRLVQKELNIIYEGNKKNARRISRKKYR